MYGSVDIDPRLGTSLGGRYLLREVIGEGERYRRYLAEIDRRRVIATVIPGSLLDEVSVERFRDVGGRLSGLEHPNLSSLLDFGREADGALFVIEPGASWHDLAREIELKGAFRARHVQSAAEELLAGLQALHEVGLTHGGLSPAGVRVQAGEDGRSTLQLAASGLALEAAYPRANNEALLFQPPERLGGVGGDLYAVACIAELLLEGRVDPESSAVGEREELPAGLREAIDRARSADEAFVGAAEMAAVLGGAGEEPTFGRYTLLHRLARGGMGEILLARAEGIEGVAGTSRLCVIKTIRSNLAGDPELIERFLSEARVLASLAHGNIVPVYDVGRVGDTFYVAMEYVGGKDLHAVLRRSREQELRMPLPLALFIARELANGLAYAHRPRSGGAGLVHRDVSPQNTLISYDGEVKLIDFGLALGGHGRPTTREGVVLGKLCYISPEQARAEPLDRRTDIYSLGLVLFEMLTGEAFFNQPTVDEVMQHVASPTPEAPSARVPTIPAEVDAICLRAMAPERSDRYDSVAELRDDLAAALARLAPRTNPEEVGEFVARLFPDAEEEEERLVSDLSGTLPPLPVAGRAHEQVAASSLLATAGPAPVSLASSLISIDSIADVDGPDDDEDDEDDGDELDELDEAHLVGPEVDALGHADTSPRSAFVNAPTIPASSLAGAAIEGDAVDGAALKAAVTVPQARRVADPAAVATDPGPSAVAVVAPASADPARVDPARVDPALAADPALADELAAWQRSQQPRPLGRTILLATLVLALLLSAVGVLLYRRYAQERSQRGFERLQLALQKRLARDAGVRPDASPARAPEHPITTGPGSRPSPPTEPAIGARNSHGKRVFCYLDFTGGRLGMRVYVNGKLRGKTPLPAPLPLAAGRPHRVEVRYPRHKTLKMRPRCQPYQTYEYELKLVRTH